MKKKTISALILAALLLTGLFVFGGCGSAKPLSFDALMHGTIDFTPDPDRIVLEDLAELLDYNSQRGLKGAFVCGEVTGTRHFIAYDAEDGSFEGYSVSTVRLSGVNDLGRTAGFAVGDTVDIVDDYGVYFKDYGDLFELLSRESGRSVRSEADLEKLEDGTFEVVPVEGKEYTVLLHENILPMEAGRSYTFCLREYNGSREGYERLCACSYAAPFGGQDTLKTLAEKYGFRFSEDYVRIAEEISRLFEDDEAER